MSRTILIGLAFLGGSLLPLRESMAGDCNGNGVEDAKDLLPSFGFTLPIYEEIPGNIVRSLVAADLDGNGVFDLACMATCPTCAPEQMLRVIVLMNKGDGTFVDPVEIPVGWPGSTDVGEIAADDFDGDGLADLAAVTGCFEVPGSPPCGVPNTIWILKNLGNGAFFVAGEVDTQGQGALAIDAGDIDADGDVDLAVTNLHSEQVSVAKNDGAGFFAVEEMYPTGQNPNSLAFIDLDGDGDLDMAISNGMSNTVSILWNNDDGTFTPFISIRVGTMPVQVVAADLDGDGDSDLAVANRGSNDVSVLANRGKPPGGPWLGFEMPLSVFVGPDPSSLAAADLDRDGDIDLAVSLEGLGLLRVFLKRGDGTFEAPRTFDVGPSLAALALADLNGDGMLDVAAASETRFPEPGAVPSSTRDVSVLLQTFVPRSGDLNGNGMPDECEPDCDLNGVPDEYEIQNGTATDCNGNGRPDRCDAVGSLSFAFRSRIPVGPGTVLAADLNGNGIVDLAVGSSWTGSVAVLDGIGGGNFLDAGVFPVAGPVAGLCAAQLDGDGLPDLALVGGAGLSILKKDPAGGFFPEENVPLEFECGDPCNERLDPLYVAAADLDRDGDEDLLVLSQVVDLVSGSSAGGQVNLLLNQGGGTFGPQVKILCGPPTRPAVLDLDGDGDTDAAWAVPGEKKILILENDGTGNFIPPAEHPLGSGPIELAAGDLDGDGDLDLASANSGSGSVTSLINKGGGTFLIYRDTPAGVQPFALRAADLDGDGDTDLAVGDRAGEILLLQNHGEASFAGAVELSVGIGPFGFEIADLDSAGPADLVLASRLDSVLWVILNNSTPAEEDVDKNGDGVPDVCEKPYFHRGDPNGDGRIDLSDAVNILIYLFVGGTKPPCLESANSNNDDKVDLSDAVHILSYLFLGGSSPADPGPTSLPCGVDPDPPGSDRDLGCLSYPPCS